MAGAKSTGRLFLVSSSDGCAVSGSSPEGATESAASDFPVTALSLFRACVTLWKASPQHLYLP